MCVYVPCVTTTSSTQPRRPHIHTPTHPHIHTSSTRHPHVIHTSSTRHPHMSTNLIKLRLDEHRTIQEIDFGNERGIFSPATTYLLTKFISGSIGCVLFSLVWGWYDVLLPSKDKAAKQKKSRLVSCVE